MKWDDATIAIVATCNCGTLSIDQTSHQIKKTEHYFLIGPLHDGIVVLCRLTLATRAPTLPVCTDIRGELTSAATSVKVMPSKGGNMTSNKGLSYTKQPKQCCNVS